MTEYQSVYPLFANDGQALYFMNDSSMLVTEDFELLSTYLGMFVTGGTSFNADRTQADVETIYLVKLKNGLYQNALTISLSGSGYANSISVNSTILFGDNYLRWYSVSGDTLVYHEISDPSDLTITIDGVDFPYSEFLEELNGASEYEVTQPQSSSDDDDDAQEEEEQESGTIEAEDAGKAEADGTSGSDDDKAGNDKVKKETDGSTGSASGTTSSSSGSGSASGSGSGSNSSDTASGDSSGDDGSSSGSSTSSSSGGSGTAASSYIKPTVKVSNVKIGVYTLDFDIEIEDEGGNLKKVTATAYWNGESSSQRKSAKTSGSYTISNLQSGQEITFVVTMKYHTADGSYVVEEIYKTVDLSTLSIQDGTNTLNLSYLQDTYYDYLEGLRNGSNNQGYDQIYPNQIQIKNIYLEEQDDAPIDTSTSTLDSIRYFRIKVYELDDNGNIKDADNPIVYTLSNSERSKLTQTTTVEETDGEGNVISTTTSAEGLTWTSDSSTASLDESKEYVYEFEIMDRYGDALKVDYMDDVDGESRYDGDDLITGTDSDRHAWTCAAHPTGKLTLGTATYESQTVTVALTNKDGGAQISELYLTEADSYGRYVEWDTTVTDGVTASDITGAVGTSELTEEAHFRLMEGKDADTGDTLPLYAGVKVIGKEGYDGSESMSWEKLQLPAFANNTYTITLTAVYNIGDRKGDYTVALATRSNARTTTLSTLGNVSFTRSAGDVGSDSVAYSYTSSTVSSKLLPLIYEYDYTLTDTTDGANTSALTLRVTKNYEEIEEDDDSTGIALTLEDGDTIYANEWSVNYSFQYRDRTDSSKTVYTVTGSVYLDDDGYLVRTIELDGELVATLYYTTSTEDGVTTSGLTTDKSDAVKVSDAALLSAFAVMLDLDTYADVIGDYIDYIKEMNPTLSTAALPSASSVTVEQSAMVTLDFPSQVDGEGNITLDVNSVCSIGATAEKFCDALSALDSSETATTDREFCDVWVNALSTQAAMLSVELSGLESKHTYVVEASAYAYQSGNIGVTVDDEGNVTDESGAPVITSVTTASTTLTLSTQKSVPEVNIEIFTYSSDLMLYDFYVYDPDEAIVEHSGVRSVTVSLYEYDEETGTETLIEQITGLTDCIIDDLDDAETYAQDISFSNLTEGQVYRIKVTADAYDTTPDGSSTTYGVLIGESSAEADGEDTYFSSTGVWEVTCGSSMTTGLTLEEVFSEEPYTLENQLIDFTSMEDDLDAGGTGGWEVGILSTGDGVSVTENTSYVVTPYLDLRYDKDDDGVADDLTADDVFIARDINGGTVYFYNKNKEYIGYTSYANTGADSGTGSVYVVTLPDRALNGSSGMAGSYTVSDIAYARVYIHYNYANIAFFGLLDDGYLTTMDTTSFANGGYTDVWNSLRDTDKNHWEDLGGAKSDSTYYLGSAENTTLSSTIGSGYFQNAVAIDGGDVLMITGNTTTSNFNRSLVFLDSSGTVISNTGSDGSTSYYRTVPCATLVAAPTDAAWVLVSYTSSYDGSGGSLQNGGLYILGDTTVRTSYDSWRSSLVTAATVTNQILNTGTGGASSTGTATHELLTEYISVKAGDVFLLANNSPNRSGYVAMYSGESKTFVMYATTTNRIYNYIVIPEGVDYIRIDNDAWSASAAQDQSLLNGLTYNTDGSYVINILYCGNISDVYETKLSDGGSSDLVYANIRVKLSDNDTDYLTADGENGTYQLLAYKYPWADGDDEVSDETLLAQTPEILTTGTIHAIKSEDGESWSSEVINRCRTIAVQKGYSYKVVLQADVGEREDVELGSIYFTVRGSSGDSTVYPVYGISGRYQVTAIRSDNSGDYVLNRSLTYGSDMPTYAGTLYGVLDLQGHTLTQSYLNYLFNNIGSAAKTGAVIKNGTLAFESTRNTSGTMAFLCMYNYGTLQNLQFKVNNEYPYTLNGSTKVYDYSTWGSQNNTYIIYQNAGTIENFTVEYESDLVGSNYVGFIWTNTGMIQNGYLYGDGKVLGGQYVGGLVAYNQSAGTVSGIYSTIDVWGNSEDLGGYITKGSYMGTIVGLNSGTVKGVLATGNVYTYTASSEGSNYTFGNESVYKSRGCAVGYTNSKMDTTECYYATVGTNKRNDYSSTSRNERVESGILLDSAWWIDLFGEDKLDDELEALLGDAWYPWVDMGNAAEKYSIRQPYLTLDVTSSASFDLVKAEVQEYTYQADGSAYATVKFTFINPSDYIVTNIAIEGLDCTVDSTSIQKTDESESGFYEITGTVQVSDSGDYVTGYNVSMVYYRRSANAGVNYIRYTAGSYESSSGSRVVDASFYYPLNDPQEWTEEFISSRYYWNFRIWGDEEWDFSKTYEVTSSSGYTYSRWPDSVKTFDFTGSLDGTLYVASEDDANVYVPAVDENGQVKCHTLSNMCDYLVSYEVSTGKINGYTPYGYALKYVNGGSITNLNIENFSVGLLRSEHENQGYDFSGVQVSDDDGGYVTVETPWDETLKQMTRTSSYFGFLYQMSNYASMENVHLLDCCMAPYRSGMERIGGLVGYCSSYCSFTGCSATNLLLSTSSVAAELEAGGLVGYANTYISFTDCYAAKLTLNAQSSTNVSFASYGVGGLVGRAYALTLMNCYSSGTLNSDVSYSGGLVGRVENLSDISGCYSAMNISLSAANGAGLIGGNTGTLTVDRCLYTGALSAASSSGTIHMILGYNTLSAVLTDCYAYQPHMEEGDSLIDTGAELVSYEKLTGSTDFYKTIFQDESWLCSWSYGGHSYNTTTDAHLPALAGVDTDGEYVTGALYGQLSADGSECYVPTVAEESLQITNVWAFASEDREELAENSNGNVVYDPKEGIYSWGYDAVTAYVPNDVEFELVLGNYQVKSITLDGFASGGVSDTSRFDPDDNVTVFRSSMFDPEVYEVRIHLLDEATGTYQICLLGTEVISYRDTYTITVELTNGIVLRNTFQFRNANGEEEAKYLTIKNAYEWNLYLGTESDQSTLLAAIANEVAKKNAGGTYDTLLASYADWTPYGYGTSSMNIEIGYEDGTSVNFADLYALGVTPVTNVVANNVRGATTEGDGGTTVQSAYIKGLELTNAAKTTYGLFRSIAGSLTDLSFESNTINWKTSSAASNESGLIGSLAGGMDNVSFSDIELTGGGAYFGIVGSATGTFSNVTAKGLMIESDGNYVGALTGVLYGDLTTVSVEEAEVSGVRYVGVAVGSLYTTEHEENGHEIIGGTDYTSEDGAVAYTVSEEDDWYADFMEEDDWYYVDSSNEAYKYDSLSFDYALMDDVAVRNSTATARDYGAGGVAARVPEMTSTNMGYGYLIAQNVTVENVTVGAMMYSGSEAYVGGLAGYTRAFMAYNITLKNVYVDGSDGTIAGGMIGCAASPSAYDYSAVGASGDRVTYFMSVAENIDAESVTVIGGRQTSTSLSTADGTAAYVGGLFGRINNGANVHDVTLKDIAVYGAGSYVGGLDGRATHNLAAYFTDVTAEDVQVYNEGISTYSYNTGGLFGYGGAIRRLTATDITVSAQGVSTYVGGVSGGQGSLLVPVYGSSGYAEPIYTVKGVQVYGYNDVGGIGGYNMQVRYLSAEDINVIGTGDNVGGLVGLNGYGMTYVSASGITVTGRGANVGGAVGRTTSYISYSDFADITVRATGLGASSIAVAYLNGALTSKGDLAKGSAVGGVAGAMDSYISYVSVSDVEVYASGSYVGGVVGATNSYIAYVVADDLDVHASGDDVGGMAGHLCTASNCYANSVTDADVYTAGDYVGGFAGYVRSSSSSYANALYSNMVQATVTTTEGKYAGGFAGYSYYVYQFFDNTVEADVSAAGNYAGGMIGYALRPTDVPALYYYRNIVTSKVTGADYVGGQIGYANTTLTGAYYRCVTAAALKATTGTHVSYFYTDANATEAYQSDYNWNNNASHPFTLYLWSGSSITIGDGEPTLATNQTFASNLSSRNGQTAIYWTNATNLGNKSSLNGESYQIKLVTTDDLKNINLYTGGNAYDALGISVYSGTVTPEGSSTVYYSNMDNMVGIDNVWNQYGLDENMVQQSDTYTAGTDTPTLYLPSPINPLRMSRDVMKNVNSIYRFSGYQNETIALGTAVSDGSGSVTYTLKKGICVPGTTGSILSASNTNSAENLADVDFKNSPKIYAANAYTLNVEFTSDDTYDGAVITAYCTDANGNVTTIGYETTAVDGTLTYGMYYDFQTTVTVEIANAPYFTKGEPTSNRTVLYSFEVTPSSVTRKVVMSGSYMYAIGGDGLIYQYYTSWSAETEKADVNNNLETDEYFINLVLDSGGNVTALTNKGTIWLVAGTDTNSVSGCTLNLTGVGEAVSTNLTTASAGAVAPQRVLGSEYVLLATSGNDLSGMLSSETDSIGSVLEVADTISDESEKALEVVDTASGSSEAIAVQHVLGSEYILLATSGNDLSGMLSSESDTEETDSTSDDTSSTEAASSDSSEGTSAETTSGSSETASGSTAAALEEEDTTSGSSEATSEEIDTTSDSSDTVAANEFDSSLLDADPIYEFDYGDYHICTYLTYSLIYDADGGVTLRNMQLFVKDGQLFALNAPDDIVPGSILIDTYQGNTYMTVLRDDGQLVDLMDEINYPDDFVNRNIKNISSNLYSDLTYVQVEYEDGAIVIFNYLTGSVIFEQEGEESEGTDVLGDFWSFLTGFFQDKLDTAYAEVTNAYQNAVTMKDFLSTQLWRNWFASEETSDEYVDGDAEDSAMSLASDSEEEETGGEYVDGDADESTVLGVSDLESTDGTGSSESDGTEATIIGSIPVYDGEDVTASDSEESEDAAADESGATGSAADGEGDAQDGVSAVSESGATGSATESADSADAETSEAQEESVDETVAAYMGETAQEAAVETASSEGGASIEDALIIAYDSNANGYAVYSTSDLLSKSDETLVSVDEQLENYLSSGGEVTGSEGKILSLEVTSSQQNGLVILALIGAAVGLMLVVLLVQRTARRRRRSSR